MRPKLSAAMADKGVSHTQLAKAIGVTRPMVSQYISGRSNPSFSVIFDVARYLHIPSDKVEELWKLSDTSLPP